MNLLRIGCIALCALAAACGDAPEETAVPALPPATLPGVYAGVYPCANCAGIDTKLWLRQDGRFFLEQAFPGDEASGEAPMTSHALGRWQWREGERVLALMGEGPERQFERPAAELLLMRSSSPLEHRLERTNATPEFGSTIRLRGMARPRGEGYVFSECLTGYELPFATGGDYRRFTRQFRSVVPRGQPARVEIEARFAWDADGTPQALTILRFVTLRTDSAC
jgi:copper homeostasis protein (lipoprotein)